MKRPSAYWLLVLFAFVLVGCPKKKVGDTGEGGVSGAGATPTNSDDITRYPYEKKIDNDPATTGHDGVVVHKSPPDGTQVTTLPNGTNVIKIAQNANSWLVTFDDPTSNKRMMGWVTDDAFSAAVAAPSATGGGHWVPPVKKDAGAAIADAGGGGGGATTADAGGGGGTATADAGGGGGQPTASGPIIAPTGGNCPANYTLATGMCHLNCSKGPECGSRARCTNKLCQSLK